MVNPEKFREGEATWTSVVGNITTTKKFVKFHLFLAFTTGTSQVETAQIRIAIPELSHGLHRKAVASI